MIYTQATKLAQYVNTSNQSNNSFIVYPSRNRKHPGNKDDSQNHIDKIWLSHVVHPVYAKKTTTNNALIAMIKKSLSDIDNKPRNYSRCDTYE